MGNTSPDWRRGRKEAPAAAAVYSRGCGLADSLDVLVSHADLQYHLLNFAVRIPQALEMLVSHANLQYHLLDFAVRITDP